MGKKNYGSVYGDPYQRFRYILKYLENYYGRKTMNYCLTGGWGSFTLLEVPKMGKNYLSMPI